METVKAVKCTCGYDSETNKFMISSLANKLGNVLFKVSKLKAHGLISNHKELVRNASEFQDIHGEKWDEMISFHFFSFQHHGSNVEYAHYHALYRRHLKMHLYLSQVQDECSNSLSESPSTKAWMELTKGVYEPDHSL